MEFDVFFSICQTEVDGYLPSERVMFENFFEQAVLADELGYGTAWIAESHLSTEVQKQNPGAVIPHFVGEIAVNTDFLQIVHRLFRLTKRINAGSAIMNILANGGPIAAAERVRMFLSLHELEKDPRLLHIGFAAGRFPFINVPYGIVPRTDFEAAAWPVLKGKVFQEATELFLRLLGGETLHSGMTSRASVRRSDFRSEEDWQKVVNAAGSVADEYAVEPRWQFPKLKIVPSETSLENLRLLIGTHDPETQLLANRFMPVGVFNLSITPGDEIENTNVRMADGYHSDGGWRRRLMPRTVLVFINEEPGLSTEQKNATANIEARAALSNYWRALEGTLDPAKVEKACDNALIGDAAAVIAQMKQRFHPDDRLMLWFDFNNHDSERVMRNMRAFMEKVATDFKQI